MGRVDQDAFRGMAGVYGDHAVLGQHLDARRGPAHLDPLADPGERHGVAALLESDGGIRGDGAPDRQVERLGQDRQGRQVRALLLQARRDTAAGGRADPPGAQP